MKVSIRDEGVRIYYEIDLTKKELEDIKSGQCPFYSIKNKKELVFSVGLDFFGVDKEKGAD